MTDSAEGEGLSTGKKLTQLIIGSPSWVHRRVDTLELGAEGESRRKVSLDVTVPKNLAIAGSHGRMIVPLALIQKAMLRGFDAEDNSSKPMSVLGARENSVLALEFLMQLAPEWLMSSDYLQKQCGDHMESLVRADSVTAREAATESFLDWVEVARGPASGLTSDDELDLAVFQHFAVELAGNFLLLAEVDAALAGKRIVLKYSHDTELDLPSKPARSRTVGFRNPVPDFGFAASQHVEVRVPPGLAVKYVGFTDVDPNGTPVNAQADEVQDPALRRRKRRERAVGHVALSPQTRFDSGVFHVEVVPSRQGIYAFTIWAVTLVTASVAAALVLKFDVPQRWFHVPVLTPEARIPSPSASILLIGPALMLSWLSRTREHDLSVMLLGPLRRVLILCAIVLMLMAVAAAVPFAPLYWNILWAVVAGLCLMAVVRLIRFVTDAGRDSTDQEAISALTKPVE
ncbi:hypothetical protein ACFVTE_18255 [Arthrobacter sp. NPDC058097]|uniref:hypothetical protein n=1 Tax=Arthrobacter sp. NPDC058097 TaxID=3346340 RepID=UPI0036DA7086